jgi:invasion protein IalB
MRRWTIILLAGGLTASAAGFYFSEPSRLGAIVDLIAGRSGIVPGFVGMANFGHWRLICVRGPAPLQGLLAASAAENKNAQAAGNACRVNQEIVAPGTPKESSSADVLAAANFSLLGAKRTPALMLRLPPTAEAGDPVRLRVDEGDVVTTMVRECGGGECLAAGSLTSAEWDKLAQAKTLQIAFPAAGKQAVLLDLPVDGLREAMAAMGRAQIPAPN